ncbi:MAG: NAD(P)-binding domain-containing protein [Ignavibacteriaceae bacterium]|jgi:thioredoxin reductase (NADPH)
MEAIIENIVGYIVGIIVLSLILYFYLKTKSEESQKTFEKIKKAKDFGFHEPISLHPVIDPDICIGSGACIAACPEQDILGMVNGKSTPINASRCVGHGACFHACPVQAITLCIGTEKRGVELPHVNQEFETTIPGLFIAGELGGMGLIKNAVEQGRQAMSYLTKKIPQKSRSDYDVIIVGAGPAGISASLEAKRRKLKFLTIEQDSLGGTVANFPRQKIVMTNPMNLPIHGKVRLHQTSKVELLELWNKVLSNNRLTVNEEEKVNSIQKINSQFKISTSKGEYTSSGVLLAIGRRGSPRKLGVPGEQKEKVAYRLIEPELIHNKNVLVVGGGDSAIESALLLADENNSVTLSYRGESFSRLKPKNLEKINKAIVSKKIRVLFNSIVKEILNDKVILTLNAGDTEKEIQNDLVYIFAGGELPTKFLEQIGIGITKKFGDPILKHSK